MHFLKFEGKYNYYNGMNTILFFATISMNTTDLPRSS